MLLGLTFGAYGKTIRQIARNLETCGGYFFPLASPERRTVSTGRGSINRRVRVVDVYRMALRFEFTDTLLAAHTMRHANRPSSVKRKNGARHKDSQAIT
jgi:hypothetical protein